MKCEQYREQLSEYLDGDLPVEQRKEIGRHLKECVGCRTELRQYEKLNALIGELPVLCPQTSVTLRIKAGLQAARPAERRTVFGPVMDMEELADFLRVSTEVVGRYLDEIPSFELGGKLLFRRKRVEEWIDRKELTATADMLTSEVDMLIKT